jgi:hypothetical protein
MPKFRHYSPQLSRELVSQLYHKAKAERIPMTVLGNRLVEEALRSDDQINTQPVVENRNMPDPN